MTMLSSWKNFIHLLCEFLSINYGYFRLCLEQCFQLVIFDLALFVGVLGCLFVYFFLGAFSLTNSISWRHVVSLISFCRTIMFRFV